PRLVGVAIDIFDSNNVLVVSGTVPTLSGAFAVSALNGALGPGNYRLVATGTATRTGSLDVSLSFPGSATAMIAATQPVVTNVLNATTTIPTPFAAGDTLFLDTVVTHETGPLR